MSYLSAILRQLQTHSDDDLVDRLNYYYTGTILVLFAILVSAKQYVGYPIQCWIPAHFTEAMEQYTENYCWVQNTWWLPLPEEIPKNHFEREKSQLVYYQWVPFILAFQAVLFYIPCFFWRQLNWQSGINIEDIIQLAREARSLADNRARFRAVSSVAMYLENAITLRQKIHYKKEVTPPPAEATRMKDSRRLTYVTALYLMVKLCYCINVVLQYWMLNLFLGSTEVWFGPHLLQSLINGDKGQQWQQSGLFPRVTLCDFEVKVMGNLHRHTIQCVLMINMFNEKIFLFLWFWFGFLLLITSLSLIFWAIEMTLTVRRRSVIERHLRNNAEFVIREVSERDIEGFVCDRLKVDGVFVLRLIGQHAGGIVLTEILFNLWESYRVELITGLPPRPIYANQKSISEEPLLENLESETFPRSASWNERKNGKNENNRKFKDIQDTSLHTKRMGDNAWATAGSRIFRKQVLAPVPIYKQHKLVRTEAKKGQYM